MDLQKLLIFEMWIIQISLGGLLCLCKDFGVPVFLFKRSRVEEIGGQRPEARTVVSWTSTASVGMVSLVTLQGTNISPTKVLLKISFLFPRSEMLIP